MWEKRRLINASILITHKGKKCLIISMNLYLGWTVVLCSCALSSAPHSSSAAAATAEQPCLFNPGVVIQVYISTLVHL